MTPQNEAQMNEEFEKWLSTQNIDDPNQKYRNDLEREFCIGFGKGYREAASDAWKIQQEKIDKLERHVSICHEKIMNRSTLSNEEARALYEENKSLRSDLDKATNEAIGWLELVETEGCCSGRECGCLGKPTNREYYDLQNMREIRTRHKLGEV